MIPAYNGADLLARTMKSVLSQDPGPEAMQIEVVDDHSTKEDLKPVIDQIGQGRVAYFRQPRNVGVTANFNTCVQRSHGHWIHILHADDLVMPGFYEALGPATEQAEIGAVLCRFIAIDENDQRLWISRMEYESAGILSNWIERIAVENHVRTPAIIVRRSVYEDIGGYDTRLFHCADWDMWRRIAAHSRVWFDPRALACYREHSRSDTSKLMLTGRNVADMRACIKLGIRDLPVDVSRPLTRKALRTCALGAIDTARRMLQNGQFAGALAQIREALKTSHSPLVLARTANVIAGASVPLAKSALSCGSSK